MLRRCVLSVDGKNYNTDTQFVSYSVQRNDGSRFLVLQYQREGDELFSVIKLDSPIQNVGLFGAIPPAVGNTEKEYKFKCNISSEEEVIHLLTQEGVYFHMNIVGKNYLERVLSIFEFSEAIRSSGLAQALNVLCDPVRKLTKIEINPVELTLSVAEGIGGKKAAGRCSLT